MRIVGLVGVAASREDSHHRTSIWSYARVTVLEKTSRGGQRTQITQQGRRVQFKQAIMLLLLLWLLVVVVKGGGRGD